MFADLLHRALLVICITSAFPVAAETAVRYTVISVSGSELHLSAQFQPRSCGRQDNIFAFPTLPGAVFSGNAVFSDESRAALIPLAAGWTGDCHLQWCSYSTAHLPCADTLRSAQIDIQFAAPLYAGIKAETLAFRGTMLRASLGRPPGKKAATASRPVSRGLAIAIDHEDIYELPAGKLAELGVPVYRTEARTFRLFEGTREVPLFLPGEQHAVLDASDRMLFYGRPPRDSAGRPLQYSSINVYRLTWGETAGIRTAVVSGARRVDPTVYSSGRAIKATGYYDTIHLEQDNEIMWLGNIADRPPEELTGLPGAAENDIDNWYWGIVGATALTSFTFTLPSPATRAAARITLGLMGTSSIDSIEGDHNIEVFINDKPAGRNNFARWDGQRSFIFLSDTFTTDALNHGSNTLTLHTSSTFADRSALNWIEIAYLRSYEAYDNRLLFRNDPRTFGRTVEYTLTGFSTDKVDLWDIERGRVFNGLITATGGGALRGTSSIIFQDSIASSATYFARSAVQRSVPLSMKLDTLRDYWDTVSRVDYIAIGPDSFRTDAEPLLRTHRKRGLSTIYVAIEDLYNRFSGGRHDPECIRLFLKHLFGRLSGNLPRFLLLCGDTTHDLDKNNRSRNLVPTHLSRIPGWGPGADDGYFSTINDGDLFPDISVGRLPAQNRDEMRRLAEKTARYIETPNRGYWRDNLLMLGGGEPIFSNFNDEAVAEIIGNRMHLLRMDADPGSRFYKDEFAAPRLIAGHLNAGVLAVNFNGHGGGNVWSDNNFFGYHDLALLHNGQWGGGGRLPVVFSFTCLTGFFESSNYRSLGEDFIRTEDDGAIAFYGASAYTSRNGNLIMNKLLLDAAFSGDFTTLGDLIDYTENSMLAQFRSEYLFLVRQYNLLGDPALPWILTPDTLRVESSLTSADGPLIVSGTAMPIRSGSVKLSIGTAGAAWDQTTMPVRDGVFSASFPLKEGMTSTLATVRAYAWNDSVEVRGWIPFIKDTLLVADVRIFPERPSGGDSVMVSCLTGGIPDSQTAQLYCLYGIAAKNSDDISFTGIPMTAGGDRRWATFSKIYLPVTSLSGNHLMVYFRLISGERTLQSPLFSFTLGGRPDLAATSGRLSIGWRNDSLSIPIDVLNTGSAAAPPFSVSFIWNPPDAPGDTFAVINTSDSLAPGKRRVFDVAFPDTQGNLVFYVQVNAPVAFTEAIITNNRIEGSAKIYYRDLRSATDSLAPDGVPFRLSPARAFDRSYRVFLFEDTIAAAAPLSTPSRWTIRRDGKAVKWRFESRPLLSTPDSICWTATPDESSPSVADTTLRRTAFMEFDTAIGRWRYCGSPFSDAAPASSIGAATALSGAAATVSLADIADVQVPELLASVYGKTLDRLDYAAKNRPVTLFLSDPSGILPQSIALFLNGKPLSSGSFSSTAGGDAGDLRSLTLTAYPEAQRRVDSLQVRCTDLAGNLAKRTFAYLPGSDLAIRSFSCHPNPFSARRNGDGTISMVRFAFLLTDVASSVTLSVYTVSGKKIKSWSLGDLIGYHQVAWDGRDGDGYRIANGTYYAKLVAKNDRKKAREIIRIAKLEGF